MNNGDGPSKTESFCVPEYTDVEFVFQDTFYSYMAINNIYAEITGPADTVTLDATHNGNSGWGATVRLYDSSGSFTNVNTNDVIYTDSSFPGNTNFGGSDSDDSDPNVQ